MTTYIFLHGSFHAAWNWHKVIPIILERGDNAIAMDLPGHGLDRTHYRNVTLAACVDRLLTVIDRVHGDVVLVAHSRNGIVASQAAEERSTRIMGIVYLAAYLIPNGKSMMEYAVQDRESLILQNVAPTFSTQQVASLTRTLKNPIARRVARFLFPRRMQQHRLRQHIYREALYHDCEEEITALANVVLEPESNWSGFTPLSLSKERYYTVPKVYIECLEDRAVTPMIQRKMVTDTPCDKVLSMNTGHSPFFSQPEALVERVMESTALFHHIRGGAVATP